MSQLRYKNQRISPCVDAWHDSRIPTPSGVFALPWWPDSSVLCSCCLESQVEWSCNHFQFSIWITCHQHLAHHFLTTLLLYQEYEGRYRMSLKMVMISLHYVLPVPQTKSVHSYTIRHANPIPNYCIPNSVNKAIRVYLLPTLIVEVPDAYAWYF